MYLFSKSNERAFAGKRARPCAPKGHVRTGRHQHDSAGLTNGEAAASEAGERGRPYPTGLVVCSTAFCGVSNSERSYHCTHQLTKGERATDGCIPFRLVLVAT